MSSPICDFALSGFSLTESGGGLSGSVIMRTVQSAQATVKTIFLLKMAGTVSAARTGETAGILGTAMCNTWV